MNNPLAWTSGCRRVLGEVFEERVLQEKRYGDVNDMLEDGTGEWVEWLKPYSHNHAQEIEGFFRDDYEAYQMQHGKPTWMHLVREEVAEAFQESDPERLAEELIQVAALCVSWVERIRAR